MDHKIRASINCAQKWITKHVKLQSREVDHSTAQECTNNGRVFTRRKPHRRNRSSEFGTNRAVNTPRVQQEAQ